MSREEAIKLLRGYSPVSYELLDEIFKAFGFLSDSPSFDTEVYYHKSFKCGLFTARDDGLHHLTEQQKGVVLGMIQCVILNEQYSSK